MLITCVGCSIVFTPKHPNAAKFNQQRFCSTTCANQRHRIDPSLQKGRYETTVLPDTCLLGPKGLSVPVNRLLLFQRIGPGPHECHWCRTHIEWRHGARNAPNTIVSDHVDGNKRNNAPDNIVPSCCKCNLWRANPLRIRHGELVVTHPNGTRTRAVMVKCGHCGKEFPKSVTAMKAGRRHACSRSCSGHVSRL
jgi:hypothetical protein